MRIALGCVLKSEMEPGLIDYIAHIDRVDFLTEEDVPILDRSIDRIIATAESLGYERLVVFWEGTIAFPLYGRNIEKAFAELSASGALCMGHIIDRHQHAIYHGKPLVSGYELFPISLLVDLQVWKRLGKPTFGEDGRRLEASVVRSDENIHDLYTPPWIGAGGEPQTLDMGRGWNFIKASLDEGLPILNVPKFLRVHQAHIYGDVIESLQRLQDNPQDEYVHTVPKLRQAFQNCRDNWYGNPQLRQYFLDNTESHELPSDTKRSMIDGAETFILPCSGFKWLTVSRAASPERFIHYDAIPTAVEAAKYVLHHFDGSKGSLERCEAHLRDEMIDVLGSTERVWRRLAEAFEQPEIAATRFLAMKNVAHTHVVANILRDPECIIPPCKKLFLSISDIPLWMLNMQAIGSEVIRLKLLHLCDVIKSRAEDYAVIHGKLVRHGRFFLTPAELRDLLRKDRFFEPFLKS